MTNAELKQALFSKEPVMHMGTEYECVSAIIYRVCKGELYITAELSDRSGHSVTIVHGEKVEKVPACST
ncbi:MAG: hypothetical protein IJV41_07050 [Oscillospiraceae bacterium]|nr:hypothetical protein [Oscillospiraceae bacterium]